MRKPKPIVYITGGSTGALSLNTIVFPIVHELVKQYVVVHQTGQISLAQAHLIEQSLSTIAQKNYIVEPYFTISSHAWFLQHSTLIVGRSGANTVGEIAALGRIALFVPLPWSAGAEQYVNAMYLALEGTCEILDQQKISSQTLLDKINLMVINKAIYQNNATWLSRGYFRHGASQVVEIIREYMV